MHKSKAVIEENGLEIHINKKKKRSKSFLSWFDYASDQLFSALYSSSVILSSSFYNYQSPLVLFVFNNRDLLIW